MFCGAGMAVLYAQDGGEADKAVRENLMAILGTGNRSEVLQSKGRLTTGQLTLSVSAVMDDDDDFARDQATKARGNSSFISFIHRCPMDRARQECCIVCPLLAAFRRAVARVDP